jgi:hypothetical protein
MRPSFSNVGDLVGPTAEAPPKPPPAAPPPPKLPPSEPVPKPDIISSITTALSGGGGQGGRATVGSDSDLPMKTSSGLWGDGGGSGAGGSSRRRQRAVLLSAAASSSWNWRRTASASPPSRPSTTMTSLKDRPIWAARRLARTGRGSEAISSSSAAPREAPLPARRLCPDKALFKPEPSRA